MTLELDETAPLVVTDAGLLERVVANLVVQRGAPLRRQAGRGCVAQELPSEIAILVVDRGPGVPVDQRDRMFEPFQRLGDTGAGRASGSGSPSPVAWPTRSAPTLTAEDTPGGGLTMLLSVPRCPSAGGAVVTAVHPAHKVLVVDDEPALARALAINLRANGWEVVTAARRPQRRSRRPPTTTPTWCCSTSACRTWTAPR